MKNRREKEEGGGDEGATLPAFSPRPSFPLPPFVSPVLLQGCKGGAEVLQVGEMSGALQVGTRARPRRGRVQGH